MNVQSRDGSPGIWNLLSSEPAPPRGRPAAVLVSVWPPDDPERVGAPTHTRHPPGYAAWRVLYIVRGTTGGKHDGQIAFPGGALEAGDGGAVGAAFREAREELGLDPGVLRLAGFLPPLAIPVSGFAVVPVVATVQVPDVPLRDAPGEVAGHFLVPLATLASVRSTERFVRAGRPTRFPVFPLPRAAVSGLKGNAEDIRIWGATAWITARLLDRVLRSSPAPPGTGSES